MKAILLAGIQRMELADVPQPGIEENSDILLKVEKVGICGSDVHYYKTGRIGSQVVEYPYIVGHECSGTVAEVGRGVENLKVGERIVIDPAAACGGCDQCRMGRENTCRKLRFLGTPGQGAGCLSEYIVMPERSCYAIGEKISLEQGVLCEPLAIGVYSVKQSLLREGAKMAILGSGPIGLSCMAAAKAEGAKTIYMTDRVPERMDIARNNGAAWVGNPDEQDIVKEILEIEPRGLDVVYECAGQQETLDEAVELLRPGGRLMLIGIPELDRISFAIDKIRRKEITIVNVRRQNGCTQSAIDLIASGKADVDFMITHRFKPEQTQAAFDMVGEYSDGVIKALVEF